MHWIPVYITVLLYSRTYAASVGATSRKNSFCGSKLTRIMSQFCLIYPSPPEHRQKRQIVTECCYNKCSLDYLLENYCGTVDMEALERFKLMDSEPVETTTAISKRSRRNRLRISSEEKELMRSSLRSRRGRRGKRNCTCKKHHRGRKSKKSKQKLQEILSRRKAPLPEAKIGEIEEHQDPFYVIDFSK